MDEWTRIAYYQPQALVSLGHAEPTEDRFRDKPAAFPVLVKFSGQFRLEAVPSCAFG
jgi:hypothetical protein